MSPRVGLSVALGSLLSSPVWKRRACLAVVIVGCLASPAWAAVFFSTTNLVTNDQLAHPAQITDPALVNPWGISHSGSSPFWVSDNGTGVATLYNVNPANNATSKNGLTVTIPGAGNVTGQAFSNVSGQFNGDTFLFVSEDGTISGWRNVPAGNTMAEVLQLGSPSNSYKGTTQAIIGSFAYLYSTNFATGHVDVLKGNAANPNLTGSFTDPNLPSGYSPFGIANLGGTLYVTYAIRDPITGDDVAAPGNGIVDAFDLQGNLLRRVGTGGTLDSPWGLAIAPASFGQFAGDLLVGNFGYGTINVFNPVVPNGFLGQLLDGGNNPLHIEGLWALMPGNNGSGGSLQSIYFSAGPDEESNGLFGVITAAAAPEPATLALLSFGLIGLSFSRRRQH